MKNFEVTKSINIIESLKSELLYKVAELFRYQGDDGSISDKSETAADLIILLYLLGALMGCPYKTADKNIINRLKAAIKSEEGEWREELKILLRHFEE